MNTKHIAIVTGATGGLGQAWIQLLLKEKEVDEIWAIARNEKKLGELRQRYGKKIQIFSVDLSRAREIDRFGLELKKKPIIVKYLVNNAGYGKFASFRDIDRNESVNMVDLNISGVISMGLLCISYMEKGCHIINIASMASFLPLPYLNIYSATKAFVRNYSRALNVELREKGIRVTAVCPGWIQTDFFQRAAIGAEKTARNYIGITTPDKVAQKALSDAKHGKDISVYGFLTKCIHLAAKVLPQRLMMSLWMKQQHF